jgi:hypothetical protein
MRNEQGAMSKEEQRDARYPGFPHRKLTYRRSGDRKCLKNILLRFG